MIFEVEGTLLNWSMWIVLGFLEMKGDWEDDNNGERSDLECKGLKGHLKTCKTTKGD